MGLPPSLEGDSLQCREMSRSDRGYGRPLGGLECFPFHKITEGGWQASGGSPLAIATYISEKLCYNSIVGKQYIYSDKNNIRRMAT